MKTGGETIKNSFKSVADKNRENVMKFFGRRYWVILPVVNLYPLRQPEKGWRAKLNVQRKKEGRGWLKTHLEPYVDTFKNLISDPSKYWGRCQNGGILYI